MRVPGQRTQLSRRLEVRVLWAEPLEGPATDLRREPRLRVDANTAGPSASKRPVRVYLGRAGHHLRQVSLPSQPEPAVAGTRPDLQTRRTETHPRPSAARVASTIPSLQRPPFARDAPHKPGARTHAGTPLPPSLREPQLEACSPRFASSGRERKSSLAPALAPAPPPPPPPLRFPLRYPLTGSQRVRIFPFTPTPAEQTGRPRFSPRLDSPEKRDLPCFSPTGLAESIITSFILPFLPFTARRRRPSLFGRVLAARRRINSHDRG